MIGTWHNTSFCHGSYLPPSSIGVCTDSNRWFALVRIWDPWLAPRQGKTYFELDKEAVLCSFLSQTGRHLVLLAISGVDDVMTLFTSTNGAVNLHVCHGSVKEYRHIQLMIY